MTAIAIFVKTPGLSPVKSRLAATVGPQLAIDCHCRCAQTVAEVAVAAQIGPVYWAIAETAGLDHPLWQHLPRLIQPEGSLGQRMQSIHEQLLKSHGSAVLLGADLPQLSPLALRQAHARLTAKPRAGVLGPATDGGFWLLGSNHPLPADVWTAPQYGHDRVLEDFQTAADGLLDWAYLDPQTDLDDAGDLAAVMHALHRLTRRQSAQTALLEWLTHQFPQWTTESP